MHFPKKLSTLLENREQEGILRKLKTSSGLIDFCSNDYLGFSTNNELSKINAKNEGKTGSTGSRLISGNTSFAEDLEKKIAHFHHSETALLFNSGYDANLGLLSSVPQKNDLILFDELSHASIYDGIRLSFAKHYKFRHNDVAHLKELIDRNSDAQNIYIVVESIYSMDGDVAPLKEIVELLSENCYLIVDEAHATGVFGEHGKGVCNEFNIEQQLFARVVTFGKALGCHGAVVLGSEALRNYLVNFARSFIYTTALPMDSLQNVDSAYQLLATSQQQQVLQEKIKLFQSLSSGAKNRISSNSAIQCFVVEGNHTIDQKAHQLQDAGFDIKPIKSPTVPEGKERIRICLHSFNSENEIQNLVEKLKSLDIMKL